MKKPLLGELLIEATKLNQNPINEVQIQAILQKQIEYKSKGVNISLGDFAVQKKLIERKNLIILLEKNTIKLRVGELLLNSNVISEEQLQNTLKYLYREHLKGEISQIGDILTSTNQITNLELSKALILQKSISNEKITLVPNYSLKLTEEYIDSTEFERLFGNRLPPKIKEEGEDIWSSVKQDKRY